jgi:SAM-dependent methyltransferase
MKLRERIIRRLHRREILRQISAMTGSAAELELRRQIASGGEVLDLGSGPNPVQGATVAVDLYLDARHRGERHGEIEPDALARRGITFVNQSISEKLPFRDGQFQFTYCSHVIEHVDRPGDACNEMMRVSRQGLLRCPAAMAEFMLGREYHKWLVLHRGGSVLFIEKSADEFQVFGRHDDLRGAVYNPFEALVDWEGMAPRTPACGLVGKLKRRIQALFYSRTPLMEVNLFWRGGFRWHEVLADGTLRSGGRDGTQWFFDVAGDKRAFGGEHA